MTNANGSPTTTDITGGSMPSGNVSCIEIGASENELLVTYSNYGVTSVWYQQRRNKLDQQRRRFAGYACSLGFVQSR
ncbi:MAG: hypothetical protein R3C26_09495 [Calditrichia bacterium]